MRPWEKPKGKWMRKPRTTHVTAGLAAAGLAVLTLGATPAGAAPQRQWRATYVSPDTGYDDFGLYAAAGVGYFNAWAVGSRRQGAGATGAVLHWNGLHWSDRTPPGSTGSFQAIGGSSPFDVWALGVTANGADRAWHWNGLRWTSVPTNGYDAGDVAVLSRKDAWAVGGDSSGDSSSASALHWDGTAWRKVPMPVTAFKLAAVSSKDIWAVGEGANDQPYTAHWNGTAWKSVKLPKVPLPKGTTGFSYFNDVAAVSKSNVWAVGRLYWRVPGKPGHNQAVLMHWDGHKWSLKLGPTGNFALTAASDGKDGIWYSGENGQFIHLDGNGTATSAKAPVPDGRQSADIRDLASMPGGKVLAVGQVPPASGGDESWDALIEQYGR